MDLAEFRLRYTRQSAKALFKPEEQNRVTRKGYNFIAKQQNHPKKY